MPRDIKDGLKWLSITVLYVLFCILVVMGTYVMGNDEIELIAPEGDKWVIIDEKYEQGFNDALTCISLLHLELQLKRERKTFGEMNDICRERHAVRQIDAIGNFSNE